MSEALALAREIATQYADKTNDKIETYYKQTSDAIREMSTSISTMARSVQESNQQLARYEERQMASSERLERLETGLREQGIMQRDFERATDARIDVIRDEVRDNSTVRKVAVWLTAAIIAAMIGGGMIFSSMTGKTPNSQVTQTK